MTNEINSKPCKRYELLDIIKLFAAYMVVFIHISFQGTLGKYVLCLARFAVPFFFIISGYFSYNSIKTNNSREIDRKIKSTGRIYLYSIFGYILMFICILRKPEKVMDWLSAGKKTEAVFNFFLWNKFAMIEMEHLWYLGALLYCYLMFRCFSKKTSIIQYLPALLIVNLVCSEFRVMFGIGEIPNYITRNAWFCALPCFSIGWVLRDKFERNEKMLSFKSEIFFGLAILSELIVLIEMTVFGIAELYVGSIFTAIFLLLFGIKARISKDSILRVVTNVDSSFIYIFHSVTAVILRIVLGKFGVIKTGNVFPLLTCFVVSILSVIWSRIKKRMVGNCGGK